jgi:diamine N-acetyltransferase
MNQVFCNISATNIESIRLFEKCGFQLIGTKKQWNQVSKNQFEDELMYQILF